jgi:hypothetical protein
MKGMENIIAVFAVILLLAGILLFAKKFLKAPKGKLPDCCGPRGNRDIDSLRRVHTQEPAFRRGALGRNQGYVP